MTRVVVTGVGEASLLGPGRGVATGGGVGVALIPGLPSPPEPHAVPRTTPTTSSARLDLREGLPTFLDLPPEPRSCNPGMRRTWSVEVPAAARSVVLRSAPSLLLQAFRACSRQSALCSAFVKVRSGSATAPGERKAMC